MNITVRHLEENDLDEADRILRLSFGTFIGLPDPMSFGPGCEFVKTRYRTNPAGSLAADIDGKLVGTNFIMNWGSFGVFGPLTVLPDYWDKGVGKALLEKTMEIFQQFAIEDCGLFTFADSPKHIHLYEKFGFKAGYLTPLLMKSASPREDASYHLYSDLSKDERVSASADTLVLTGSIFECLDLTREIRETEKQKLGDTIFVTENGAIKGFAVCHCGAGSEAGNDTCYVKFGAVRPGPDAESVFSRLLAAVEDLCSKKELKTVFIGVNMARRKAYRAVLDAGFRTRMIGVAMETRPENGFNREDVFVLDDWR